MLTKSDVLPLLLALSASAGINVWLGNGLVSIAACLVLNVWIYVFSKRRGWL